ncbi:MAG: PilN domain-containing protein [Deltaproteobacteria bacterium]|nr:PilN domain-containing protein [Deltaproteobacteria bacterium]
MIQHVNFFEKATFVLTYRKMATVVVMLVGFFVLSYGLVWVQAGYFEKKVLKLTEEVNQLKIKQEKLFTESTATKDLSGKELVRQFFSRLPQWSQVLQRMVKVMPTGVWLVSLKSYEKADLSSGRGLLLSGEAKEARDVSLFLKELDLTPYFVKPILTDSKQEKRGTARVFTFTIDLGISSHLKPVESS